MKKVEMMKNCGLAFLVLLLIVFSGCTDSVRRPIEDPSITQQVRQYTERLFKTHMQEVLRSKKMRSYHILKKEFISSGKEPDLFLLEVYTQLTNAAGGTEQYHWGVAVRRSEDGTLSIVRQGPEVGREPLQKGK